MRACCALHSGHAGCGCRIGVPAWCSVGVVKLTNGAALHLERYWGACIGVDIGCSPALVTAMLCLCCSAHQLAHNTSPLQPFSPLLCWQCVFPPCIGQQLGILNIFNWPSMPAYTHVQVLMAPQASKQTNKQHTCFCVIALQVAVQMPGNAAAIPTCCMVHLRLACLPLATWQFAVLCYIGQTAWDGGTYHGCCMPEAPACLPPG